MIIYPPRNGNVPQFQRGGEMPDTLPDNARWATDSEKRAIESGNPLTVDDSGYVVTKTQSEIDAQEQARIESEARSVRDERLRRTDHYVLPDRDFTIEFMDIIRDYRQELRDWPDTAGFPDTSTLPSEPTP